MRESSTLEKKIRSQYRMTQVGVIVKLVSPVSPYLSFSEVKEFFDNDKDLKSLIVESNSSSGLIHRRVLEKNNSFFKNFTNFKIENLIEDNTFVVDSRQHINKVMDQIVLLENEKMYDDFLIFHDGKILGIGKYQDLINHVNFLKNMELNKAREIQQFLFDKNTMISPYFDYYIHTQMAHELGGDYYKVIKLGNNLHMLSCFDVSGKNISASLTTAILSSFFSTMEISGQLKKLSPEDLIKTLNKVCFDQTTPEVYIVGIFLFINKNNNTINIYNLSYTYPYLLRKKNDGKFKISKLNKSLSPLGLESEISLSDGKITIPISPGLKLFSFSDGFTDIRNEKGEILGEEKLEGYIKKYCSLNSDIFIKTILKDANTYMNNSPQGDDMTALVLSF